MSPLTIFAAFVIALNLFFEVASAGPTPAPLAVSEAQLATLRARLPKLQKPMKFYHWTKLDPYQRWLKQGEIDWAEFQVLLGGEGLAVSGGGFYIAESPFSSRNFGDFALAFFVPAGTLKYDANIVTEVFGKFLSGVEKAQLGQRLEFIDNYAAPSDWWITHSHSLLRRGSEPVLKSAHADVDYGNMKQVSFAEIMEELGKVQIDAGSIAYAQHLMSILYSENVQGFFHALYNSPGNLDSQLTRESALRTTSTVHKWLLKPEIYGASISAKNLKKDEWVAKQISVMEEIFRDLTGAASATYRTSELVGSTITVDPYELKTLQRNSLLNLMNVSEKPNKFETSLRVKYLAPSQIHVELKALLERTYDGFRTTPQTLVALAKQLTAIAPFSNSNDVVIRTYLNLASKLHSMPMTLNAYSAIPTLIYNRSEDALLADSNWNQQAATKMTSTAALKVAYGIYAELVTAAVERRTPSYQSLQEQIHYPVSFDLMRAQVDKTLQIRPFTAQLKGGNHVAAKRLALNREFWISDFGTLKELLPTWIAEKEFALVESIRNETLEIAKAKLLSRERFDQAVELEFPNSSQEAWMDQILNALPIADPMLTPAGDRFPLYSVLATSKFKNESLQKIATNHMLKRVFNPLLVMVKEKKSKEIPGMFADIFKQFGRLEETLGLTRAWSLEFLHGLLTDDLETSRIKGDLAGAFFGSRVVLLPANDAEFTQGLELIKTYLKSNPARFDFGIVQTYLIRVAALLDAKIISSTNAHSTVTLLMNDTGAWLAGCGKPLVEVLQRLDVLMPGQVQSEVQWTIAHLDKIEFLPANKPVLQAQLDKLLESSASPSGRSALHSLNSAPESCSDLTAGTKPKVAP